MGSTVADPALAVHLSRGYSRAFGFALPQHQVFIPGGLPSGYLISSARDMARYMIAQLGNIRPDGQPLLQPETLKTMRTPPVGITGDYAMGWMALAIICGLQQLMHSAPAGAISSRSYPILPSGF